MVSGLRGRGARGCPKLMHLRESQQMQAAEMERSNSDIFTAEQLECINGSLRTADRMIALAAKSASSSLISLWREITLPPFLLSRTC
jgi:hypothetical protein